MGFAGFLRQSTAVNVIIGPFVSSTDGDAEMTGLTIAQADVRLSKNAAADAQKNDATSCAHEGDGFYMCELDATDANTVGLLTLWVHVATALAVRHDYQIVEEAVYDALYAASALGYVANAPVNVAQFGGSSGTFASGRPEVNATHEAGTALTGTGAVATRGIVDRGTLQAATASTAQLRSALALANDIVIGSFLTIDTGTGAGQTRLITDFVGATDTATVEPDWTATPDATSTYTLVAAPPSTASVAGIAATLGAAGAGLTALPWNAAWDAEVQSEATDALNAYDPPTHAELTAGLAAADDAILTQVALVKTVTDKVDDTLEDDAGTFRFTSNALEQAPSGTGASAASIRAEIDANSTQLIAIKAKTDGLPSDPADASVIAGRFDTLDTSIADLPTNAELATSQAAADDATLAQIALVKAKTDALPTDPADQSLVIAATDAIIAALAALNNLAAGAAMTLTAGERLAIADAMRARQMTQGYAAVGVAPTVEQALFMVLHALTNFAISGTTVTVKKLDGTTAFTDTLDSAVTPTSRTRAT